MKIDCKNDDLSSSLPSIQIGQQTVLSESRMSVFTVRLVGQSNFVHCTIKLCGGFPKAPQAATRHSWQPIIQASVGRNIPSTVINPSAPIFLA